MSKEQQDNNMLSVYIPMPPKPLDGSIPCTCCIKCSQERLYRMSPSHERFYKTSPSNDRIYRASPSPSSSDRLIYKTSRSPADRLYKSSPSPSADRLYKTSPSPSESFKNFNQPIPTKTKIFKPTVLMNRHVSTMNPQHHQTSPRKRTFEHYTGEQHFRKTTTVPSTSLSSSSSSSSPATTSKLPRVQHQDDFMTTMSSEKQFVNHAPLEKRSSFQRQDRVGLKSVEYYEEFSKNTIEKIPLTTTLTNTKTSVSLMVPLYERVTPSSSPLFYESHSPCSSSLIPTPPPPLLRTPSQTSPSTTTLRIPSLIDPKKRRLADFKAGGSFDSTNSVDSSFTGSDEEEQVNNEPKAHRAVVERAKYERTIKLYKFLIDLLEDHHPCVMWINRETGIFKITDSEQLAQLWGEVKMNASMTYEKLARSFRHYYKKGILDSGETVISPVSKCGKRKLYYKFSAVTLKRFLGIESG